MTTHAAWPRHPIIYEVNTLAWLGEVGARAGKPVALGTVPDAEWERARGVEAGRGSGSWGVWERSPEGRRIASRTRSSPARSARRCRPAARRGRRRLAVLHPSLRGGRAARGAGRPREGAGPARAARRPARPRPRPEPRRAGPPLDARGAGVLRPRHRGGGGALAGGVLQVGKAFFARGRDPTSRPGPTCCSSTRSPPGIARRSRTRSPRSPGSATPSGPTWRCSS